jgi:glycosyltransferase involved in cell wall biosynthesis
MTATPSWTIAIPTYNAEAFLEETLRSVLAQQNQAFELVVCDDRSSDGTIEIVRRVCGNRATIYLNETSNNLGLARNWNRCVELASGDWITILHHDDLLAPHFFETQRKIANLNADIGMITGPADLIDLSGNIIIENEIEFKWPDQLVIWPGGAMARVLVKNNPLRCPATSFRRDLHQTLGGFNSRWKYVVDWDFWYRLGQAAPVALVAESLAFQRWHTASETQRLASGSIDLEENEAIMFRILDENFNSALDRPLLEDAIRRRLASAWLVRATQAAAAGNRKLELHSLHHAMKNNSRLTIKNLAQSPKSVMRLIMGSWLRRSV